jgi:hypothetical protein
MPGEEQVVGGATASPEPVGMDMESAVADIASSLSLDRPSDTMHDEPEVVEKETAAPASETLAPAPTKEEQTPAAAAPTTEGDAPPDTWRKEAKEAWATVSPVVKAELAKREQDIAKYVAETKEPVAVGRRFEEIVRPHAELYRTTGVNPYEHVNALITAHKTLLYGTPQQKVEMVRNMAQQAGITLDGTTASTSEAAKDQYIAQMEARMAKLEGGVTNVTQTLTQARVSELEQSILAFGNDPANPYFNEVADQIPHLIQTGAAKTLKDAYDLAVMANPQTRQKAIDAEVRQRTEAEAKANEEKLAAAKKATATKVRSTSRARTEQSTGDIDDTLKSALASIHARDR